MPSRKLTSHCHQCGAKNHLKAQYCNQCGVRLREERTVRDAEGRAKLYADIAHPINSQCREMIQSRVIAGYRTELERAKQPGYVSRYDEDYDDDIDAATYAAPDEAHPTPPAPATMPTKAPAPPSQAQVPAPHILPPASAPPAPSSGGPHFTTPPPHRETTKETRDNLPKKQPPRGEFGAGVF
jgi:stage V sporulation protein G